MHVYHLQGGRQVSRDPEPVKFFCPEDRVVFGKEGRLLDRVQEVVPLTYTYIPPEDLATIVKTPPLWYVQRLLNIQSSAHRVT